MCTYIHIYMFIFFRGGGFYFHVRTVKVRCSLNCSWISVDSVGLNSSWRFMETKFPTVQRQFNEWIWNATSKPQPIRILSSSRAGPSDTVGPDTTVDHGGLSWLDQDCDDDYTPHLSWGCGFVSAGPCIMEQRLQTQQQQQSGLLMSPWYKYNIEDLVCCQTRPHTEDKDTGTLFTWLLEIFWANLVCPGSSVVWTSAAPVAQSSPSACWDSVWKSEVQQKKKKQVQVWSFFEHVTGADLNTHTHLCGVLGGFTVVGLQCWVVRGFESYRLLHPQ